MPSERRLRVVIDTNLFFSGMTNQFGVPRRLLGFWHEGRFELFLSAEHYAELVDVFGRAKVIQRYQLGSADLARFFTGLASAIPVRSTAPLPLTVRDPKDEMILSTALAGAADFLVTGDKDLLVLAGDPRLGSLRIVTAADFLEILKRHDPGELPFR